jgi:hypothetical protein
MTKSLFDTEEPVSTEIKKVQLKPKGIPQLLPIEDDESNIPYREQEVIIDPIIPEEPVKMSGAFFIVNEKLVADIRLEFNAEHPKYKEYLNRLKDLVSEAEKEHVLKSSSGI